MKMATIYFSKTDIAEKLGIEPNQFVSGKVESNYNEVQFDVIIDSDAETKSAESIPDNSGKYVRRQRYEDIGK